jgi:hypothetical protein
MRKLNADLLVLGLCCPVAGKSMEDWQRVPARSSKLANDHRACTGINTPRITGVQTLSGLQKGSWPACATLD